MEKILVYSTETCPYCKMVKEYLKDKKVGFEEVDVTNNQEKAKEMIDKSGQMGVPVIDIDGEIIIGFNQPKIEETLKAKKLLKE
jgi:glutaredoxin 3